MIKKVKGHRCKSETIIRLFTGVYYNFSPDTNRYPNTRYDILEKRLSHDERYHNRLPLPKDVNRFYTHP